MTSFFVRRPNSVVKSGRKAFFELFRVITAWIVKNGHALDHLSAELQEDALMGIRFISCAAQDYDLSSAYDRARLHTRKTTVDDQFAQAFAYVAETKDVASLAGLEELIADMLHAAFRAETESQKTEALGVFDKLKASALHAVETLRGKIELDPCAELERLAIMAKGQLLCEGVEVTRSAIKARVADGLKVIAKQKERDPRTFARMQWKRLWQHSEFSEIPEA